MGWLVVFRDRRAFAMELLEGRRSQRQMSSTSSKVSLPPRRQPSLRFRDATADDVPAIAGLQNAASGALTARFGEGHWSGLVSERSIELGLRHAQVRVGIVNRRVVSVLRLAQKKPWAIDVKYFTPVKRPLYLTGMVVSVAQQGTGLGRLALADAAKAAAAWPADVIRLDAYDAVAGAGGFYTACGYTERGRVVYRGCPLVYFELLLG